jgi:DNA-binding response OmpR family regulator
MTDEVSESQATDQAHVLVVDDEIYIRTALVRALTLSGYQAEEAGSGPAALAMLDHSRFDLMILDMRMPGMEGTEVMQLARQRHPDLLIIVLTGHASLDSAIAAVKFEAVDYLVKPASLQEISDTVAAALRRQAEEVRRRRLLHIIGETMDALRAPEPPATAVSSGDTPPAAAGPVRAAPAGVSRHTPPALTATATLPGVSPFSGVGSLHSGALDLDLQTRRLTVRGGDHKVRVVELTDGEVMILAVLMSQPDQVLTCRQLVRATWRYEMEEREAQSLVRPYIFRLRHKIEADAERPQLIKTVRGRGYLFAP